MSVAFTSSSARQVHRLRTLLWRYPEWWTYGLCLVGWWVMAAHALRFAHHGIHHRMPFAEELLHWQLMVWAMMLPLVGPELRAVAFASLWSRRHRALFASLLGYSLCWLLVGLPIAALRTQAVTHDYIVPMAAFAVAAVWQFTSWHVSALASCHRVPIPAARGWRADRDCFIHGGRIGWSCTVSCWWLMIACAFTGHALVPMIAGLALGLFERRSFYPRIRTASAGAALLAGYCFILGWR